MQISQLYRLNGVLFCGKTGHDGATSEDDVVKIKNSKNRIMGREGGGWMGAIYTEIIKFLILIINRYILNSEWWFITLRRCLRGEERFGVMSACLACVSDVSAVTYSNGHYDTVPRVKGGLELWLFASVCHWPGHCDMSLNGGQYGTVLWVKRVGQEV